MGEVKLAKFNDFHDKVPLVREANSCRHAVSRPRMYHPGYLPQL